jgi:hypothetical protein
MYLTSPTIGGRSVGIVRSQTKAMEFMLLLLLLLLLLFSFLNLKRTDLQMININAG